MDITLDALLAGKATSIKKNNFFKTEAYVTPFLEKTHNLVRDYNVHVELPSQYTKTNDGTVDIDDITYNRVWIEGILRPEFDFEGHNGVLGMVYGIDTKKPVAKFYKGGIRCACTNLCIFNPELLRVQEMESETALDYSMLDDIIEYTDDTMSFINRLKETPFDVTDLNEHLGSWVRKAVEYDITNLGGKIKLSPTDVIAAYKDMFVDTKSDYFVEMDSDTTMFNVYNAFTQQITDNKRDIINRCEKTLLIKDILNF